MCAIVGLITTKEWKPKQLADAFSIAMVESSTRGRDAAGIYSNGQIIKDGVGADVFVDKHKKAIRDLAKGSKVMIGHCRATTNGKETWNENNHPHTNEDWTVVHNGMVGVSTGPVRSYPYKGICDSEEIMAHLHKYGLEGIDKLTGSMSLIIMHNRTGKIFLYRSGNPMYVCRDKDTMWIFSTESIAKDTLGREIGNWTQFGYANMKIEEDTIYAVDTKRLNIHAVTKIVTSNSRISRPTITVKEKLVNVDEWKLKNLCKREDLKLKQVKKLNGLDDYKSRRYHQQDNWNDYHSSGFGTSDQQYFGHNWEGRDFNENYNLEELDTPQEVVSLEDVLAPRMMSKIDGFEFNHQDYRVPSAVISTKPTPMMEALEKKLPTWLRFEPTGVTLKEANEIFRWVSEHGWLNTEEFLQVMRIRRFVMFTMLNRAKRLSDKRNTNRQNIGV